MQPLEIGVCNWSLKIPDLDACLGTIRDKLGLKVVQLGWWDDGYKDTDRHIKFRMSDVQRHLQRKAKDGRP